MTATGTNPVPPAPPETPPPPLTPRPARWLKPLLIASLALNLLFVGGGVARFVMHGGPSERFANASQMQLIPRRFFGEIGAERRRDLLTIFRTYGPSFRDGRAQIRAQAVALADALEAEPYDPARVTSVIAQFSAASTKLMETGGQAAEEMIAKLTPDERKQLARHIRLRDAAVRNRRGGGDPDDD